MRIFNRVALGLIWVYQRTISPVLPDSCRFNPSCSVYCTLAFKRFNFFKALFLCTFRVARCNPLCRGGDDFLK